MKNEMEINGETYVLKSSIENVIEPIEGEFMELGKSYYIRIVTHHYTGRLVAINDKELLLEDASWVADSGRWASALETGKLEEVEPYPKGVRVGVNRGAICDYSEWIHDLPLEQL